ncbi:MFS transporter [Pseudactinotalea sp. Z1748]|uniref:MFS transporter n=1 Tax=Pseudactinotalea sp. Z1748 TaxID=3413027 RepID=UPI003C7D4F21
MTTHSGQGGQDEPPHHRAGIDANGPTIAAAPRRRSFTPGDRRPLRTLSWPVLAWSLWDWGSAAFNAVITTFVFTVYITSDAFGENAETNLGFALATSGVLIAVFAPISGQRADRTGRRTLWLGLNTTLVVIASAGLFFVAPAPEYLWLGLLLLAAGNVAFEFASVNYYAMLNDLSTPKNIGRVSGLGWGLGYIGGIVLLLIIFFGFIDPEVGLFGVTSENGMDVRISMLLAAAWFGVFMLPVLWVMRRTAGEPRPPKERFGVIDSYRRLFGTIAHLWKTDRNTVFFLIASAVFRDGMAGVFTFGGVVAATVFGFSPGDVIIFGIVANVVAGVFTIAFGPLDDRFGPKKLIVVSLVMMITSGIIIFAFHDRGQIIYWVFGLLLAIWVGPVQSASRTFLSRLIPKGKEGEFFGLYATTGRAVSFLAPTAYSSAILLGVWFTGAASRTETSHWGILGIATVLLAGLVLVLRVRTGVRADSALTQEPTTTQEPVTTELPPTGRA